MKRDLPNTPTSAEVLVLTGSGQSAAEKALLSYIEEGKLLFTRSTFGCAWEHWSWPGVGVFGTHKTLKHGRPKANGPDQMLHPLFIDFARAFLSHAQSRRPSLSNRQRELAVLRMIEMVLDEEGANGNPTEITLHTLNRVATIVTEEYSGNDTKYQYGQCLARIATEMQRKGLTRNAVGSFSNPIACPSYFRLTLTDEAEKHRAKQLPDERALIAINSVFAQITEPTLPKNVTDVFVTSCGVLIQAGSKRGGELFEARFGALFSEKDSEGKLQWGLRWRSFKNPTDPTRPSWFSEPMAPYAIEAYNRIVAITDEPRRFAKYCEEQLAIRRNNPNDERLRFYRYPGFPDLPEDRPLSRAQALSALGSTTDLSKTANQLSALRCRNLDTADGAYMLNSLWQTVLDRLPEGFPYVKGAKDKRLKYSEALFCMHPFQLAKNPTNPLGLWMPSLETLAYYIRGNEHTSGFFVRHRVADDNGEPIHLKSHQIRHLIDTFSHESTGEHFQSREAINALAGRAAEWQGDTYNHVPAGEYAERARRATQQADGRNAVFDLPVVAGQSTEEIQTKHWSVRLRPLSCAGVDMHYRSATIATIWGGCEHDWLLKPCPYSRDCLNCTSHVCIKGIGKDDQERLERLKKLLDKIIVQQGMSREAHERGDPGTKFWLDYQTAYRERVEELIGLLENPATPDGAQIRLKGTANTHLHRVLQQKVLESVEQKLLETDAVEYLLAAYRENRALPLETTTAVLEHRHGA